MSKKYYAVSTVLTLTIMSATARAAIVPFTENFAANNANWRDAGAVNPASWNAAGGPDGSSHVSATYSFANNGPSSDQSIFRGHASFGSSGGAFVGNWIADGATGFSVWVRHDAPIPMNFFSRYAKPFSAGAVSFEFAPVLPNTWTKLEFSLAFGTSNLILEGAPTLPFYNTVFSDIQDVQIGVRTPDSLAFTTGSYSFSIDQVSLLPEPGTAALMGFAMTTLIRRRRRARVI